MRSEDLALDYFLNHGYTLHARRLRTPHGELDLVLLDRQGRPHVVEVKTVREISAFRPLVSENQRRRLRRATLSLTGEFRKVPRLHLAAVGHNGAVDVLWDFS